MEYPQSNGIRDLFRIHDSLSRLFALTASLRKLHGRFAGLHHVTYKRTEHNLLMTTVMKRSRH